MFDELWITTTGQVFPVTFSYLRLEHGFYMVVFWGMTGEPCVESYYQAY